MAIREREARFKLGLIEVGNKLGNEVKTGHGIDRRSRSGRVIEMASVEGPQYSQIY